MITILLIYLIVNSGRKYNYSPQTDNEDVASLLSAGRLNKRQLTNSCFSRYASASKTGWARKQPSASPPCFKSVSETLQLVLESQGDDLVGAFAFLLGKGQDYALGNL